MSAYGTLAPVWDCFFGDRSAEIECWRTLAGRFGQHVLAPLAATGTVAAALARAGLRVTAFDREPDMVRVMQQRHGALPTLSTIQADLLGLRLAERDYDFAFLGSGDFHHFISTADQEQALHNLHRHLRSGGGLALALFPPANQSWSTPTRRFEPLSPPEKPIDAVWKDGATQYDRQLQRLTIAQTVMLVSGPDTAHIVHNLTLKLHTRQALRALLTRTGFDPVATYGDYQLTPWAQDAKLRIVLAKSV